GSLLLGLYDDLGVLQHVGVCASFPAAKRRARVEFLEPYPKDAPANHPWRDWSDEEAAGGSRKPGGPRPWSQGKDLSWVPLRPELVAEVAYDHMQGDRFRHMAQFRRWRQDKAPENCTFDQLEAVSPEELRKIFRSGG